jgi:hypothetical protein
MKGKNNYLPVLAGSGKSAHCTGRFWPVLAGSVVKGFMPWDIIFL